MPRPPSRRAGFTLIELLVVIAIIAILTAIIFPVFASIRENARQKTAIANMHEIQNGLAQFKLDQGRYPEVLFGYAVTGARMDNALAKAQQQNAADQYFPGLYPEYVKDPLTFTDPNNNVHDLSQVTSAPLTVNKLTTDPTTGQTATIGPSTMSSKGVPTSFYLADAYDISPQIDTASPSETNTFVGGSSNSTYVVRYQTSWTGISPADSTNYPLNYKRQLRWTNPPADTYVTCTTHHVPNSNRVIVLWEGGEAKSMNASQFLAGSVGSSDSSSVTNAKFWQVSPTNNANPGP